MLFVHLIHKILIMFVFVMIKMHIMMKCLINVNVKGIILTMYQVYAVNVIITCRLMNRRINVSVINMLFNMIQINAFNVTFIRILTNLKCYVIAMIKNNILVDKMNINVRIVQKVNKTVMHRVLVVLLRNGLLMKNVLLKIMQLEQ